MEINISDVPETELPLVKSPEERYLERERQDRIMGVLETLPPRYAVVFRMRCLENYKLPFKEVGKKLGISKGRANQMYLSARRRIIHKTIQILEELGEYNRDYLCRKRFR